MEVLGVTALVGSIQENSLSFGWAVGEEPQASRLPSAFPESVLVFLLWLSVTEHRIHYFKIPL